MAKLNQLLSTIPFMIVSSFILFSIYPTWQAAIVSIGSFCFLSFKAWLAETRANEISKIRDEIKALKNQVEALQMGRALGR